MIDGASEYANLDTRGVILSSELPNEFLSFADTPNTEGVALKHCDHCISERQKVFISNEEEEENGQSRDEAVHEDSDYSEDPDQAKDT